MLQISWLDPELAWAAGLFEGEGTITQCGGRLFVRVKITDEEVAYRFASIVRFGTVYGPYHYEPPGAKRKPHWIWHADEYEALEVLEMLWPWLSDRRHAQALDLAPLDAILLDAARQ
jgi:hypothetical protein